MISSFLAFESFENLKKKRMRDFLSRRNHKREKAFIHKNTEIWSNLGFLAFNNKPLCGTAQKQASLLLKNLEFFLFLFRLY